MWMVYLLKHYSRIKFYELLKPINKGKNSCGLMGKIVNITASYWIREKLNDMLWTDPKYDISLQILPKRDIEGNGIMKGNIVHKNSRSLVGVANFQNMLYGKVFSVWLINVRRFLVPLGFTDQGKGSKWSSMGLTSYYYHGNPLRGRASTVGGYWGYKYNGLVE